MILIRCWYEAANDDLKYVHKFFIGIRPKSNEGLYAILFLHVIYLKFEITIFNDTFLMQSRRSTVPCS
jgi:hypothetical protein